MAIKQEFIDLRVLFRHDETGIAIRCVFYLFGVELHQTACRQGF